MCKKLSFLLLLVVLFTTSCRFYKAEPTAPRQVTYHIEDEARPIIKEAIVLFEKMYLYKPDRSEIICILHEIDISWDGMITKKEATLHLDYKKNCAIVLGHYARLISRKPSIPPRR